jgi:CheY-like chemotaxis protein
MAKILLADDDDALALLLKEKLESSGHTVTVVNDGPAAAKSAKTSPPDIMILDVNMPGLSGGAAFKGLDEELTRKIPVIFISGLPQDQAHKETLLPLWARGRFMAKPVDLKKLEAAIAELLK